jgi:hypothetical protein
LPHAPQFFGSFATSTQTPAQVIWFAAQPQLPAAHTWPPVHLTPQPPQLFGSVPVGTHAPLHSEVPVGHVAVHAPAAQA